MKRPLNDEADFRFLIETFYSKIRKDNLLGPIFNAIIEEDQWSEHINKLIRFWKSIILETYDFDGNPTAKHISVDKLMDQTISQNHFGQWLFLWTNTINEYFEGENALKAKETARKMATGQFLAIWKNRN